MDIAIELIREPGLEFNEYFIHPDKKTGISEYGPFGRIDPALHPNQIKIGIVGTRETVEICDKWIQKCRGRIETDRTEQKPLELFELDANDETEFVEALIKNQAPDFIGLNPSSQFATDVITSSRWHSYFNDRQVKSIKALDDAIARVERATELIANHIELVATSTPHPDIIFIAIPDELIKCAASAELRNGNYLNLRRSLKALSMKWGVPTQIFQEATLIGNKKGLQDVATRAWNFATALYFKAGGTPWKGSGLEADTCYIGISFYKTEDTKGRQIIRSGVAQAFDYLGQGVVLRGDPFEWDAQEYGKTPHLTKEGAHQLITKTLLEYEKISGLPPKRVVVHKSSRFWGEKHGKYNELDGFIEGIESVNKQSSMDLLTLCPSNIRLARVGKYPPIRGTYGLVEGILPIIYTHGFTPYFDTYPGVHVPLPWSILERYGDSGPFKLASELLSLTKMNVNNASFSESVPITLAFSRMVGEVLKQIGSEMTIRSEYSFYM
jgi:hypothetical protein